MTRVVGLISGTSVDGIDAALVDISGKDLDIKIQLVAGATYPYPNDLRERILDVCAGATLSMLELAELDDAIAFAFAQAAQNIQLGHEKASLIGSHGQTVYHRPPKGGERGLGEDKGKKTPPYFLGYSLQLGRGSVIANVTGVTTVSNFRVADIAAGGHGAPLVPRVDAALLSHPDEARCIQNIGGIGNVTYIPSRQKNWLSEISAWDTGPGNSLLDLAVYHLSGGTKTYDEDGNWAASGTPCYPLVEEWLSHEYFHLPPPKSTGRELFGVSYFEQCLKDAEAYQLTPADLLATLTELTAASIVHSYQTFLPQVPQQVLLCGGGSRNLYLKRRLQSLLGSTSVLTTDEVGLCANFKEAIAFAVLAYWRMLDAPGNLPSATGACQEVVLGEIIIGNG
ncbi:anhydro-N-acetylmuramic acid kinase [Aetokthonos hydrillicola Thurmond2011]|jgi:anhydro-N-acetylmuramic acid kinase|uniref:Anhydro-N-acetylmuramic acid kinase n=1 Tax=Aetokthonos hydrillicola Thurmond2011 TaxID=2712845 RepID=A0AAP5ICR8_9CYAN|nr:anhydro-N-acetylmuramic acid kinase [Aetokthonos hydrillicola]MBO3462710.1 anhydro-N-acetylmuramic acid kinase [Aetokthonos hydrillicola CCALA 1050]MBW4585255.1 anhydro-N-acetylmuramic acid kinase [Aetokthonos hydrillicola CCALA 1050]MDR9896610.1 anhydro-N-acetylmuramic acid kinase [Aetokthonos hydrillicola Thurmond2011]